MPRYFFHVNDGARPDTEGVELKNLATAKCEAVKKAGLMICESADAFWDSRDFVMTVSDEDGLTLFSLMCVGTDAPAIEAPRHRPSSGAASPS